MFQHGWDVTGETGINLGIGGVASGSLTKTGIGTPQARWRETHQSGRPSIIAPMRFLP